MSENLIQAFCRGAGKRFDGTDCAYYDCAAGECALLREFDLREVFAKGRCQPLEMLKRALAKHLEKYRDLLDPAEYSESMAFELTTRLTSKRLRQGYNLYVLKGYLNKTVYCSVIELLRREEPLVKRQCGYCKYLSPSTPTTCQRAWLNTSRAGTIANPAYERPRELAMTACQEGFEPVETTSLDAAAALPQPLLTAERDDPGLLLADLANLLAKRAERTQDRKTTKQAERQYLIFCRLLALLQHGMLQQEAVQMIADALGVSVKTIKRELSEIRKFFQQTGVLE